MLSFTSRFKEMLRIIGKHNLLLLLVSLIVALASIFLNDNWLLAAREESEELSKLNNSALEISKLKVNILKAESAQRGYLLTSSKEYLSPYNQAVKGAAENIIKIRAAFKSIYVIKAYEKESALLIKLSNTIASKVAEMDLTLQLATEGNLAEAKKVMNLDSGLAEMNKFSIYSDSLLKIVNIKINEAYQSREFKRSIARTSTILSPLLLLMLVILIIKQLINELTKKANLESKLIEKVDSHSKELSEKSRLLQNLALENQTDVERERSRVAREIHDELGSILTATRMDISWVIKSLINTHPEVATKLNKTKTYIDQGISFKRQIVEDLHPSTISSFGFWPSLTNLINDCAERGSWKINLALPVDNPVLNETVSLVVYRIVQETLNNAIKYAKASEVSVHIILVEQKIKVEIHDNGIGVSLNTLTNKTHGLSGMRNRVTALGGHLNIESSKGNGLLMLAILPLHIKAALNT